MRQVEHLPMDQIRGAERNPKSHAGEEIQRSISHHGLAELPLLDGRTGRLVAGHGRYAQLVAMRDAGEHPPDGVIVDDSGGWLIPVITGWSSRSDADAEAYLIGSNRITELGGWDTHALADVLDDLREADLLALAGWDADDAAELLLGTDDVDSGPGYLLPGEEGNPYTAAVNVPQYEITGAKPAVSELREETKADALREEIRAADLEDDVREYLLAAAARHIVFDYGKAAEFYAHAMPAVQRLMEESALVIIDADDAIRNGYLKLTQRILDLRNGDHGPESDSEADGG
jgi:hypothetical protein